MNPPPTATATAGLLCPRCGCADLRVIYTRRRESRILRRRECRHCGRRVTSYERIGGHHDTP
jgi:transcriptional regulator NrdR family protein